MWFRAGVMLVLAAGVLSLAGCGSDEGAAAPTASIAGNSESQNSGGDASRKPAPKRQADPFAIVEIETTGGKFQVKLDRQNAPQTVENFLDYVRSGFYVGTVFHQVDEGFIVVAGGYGPDGEARSAGPPIRNEAHNGLSNRRGTIAMVRFAHAHSATSQFLINLADNPGLDHVSREVPEEGEPDQYGYCVFGEVTQGWEVVARIAASQVRQRGQFTSWPMDPIEILSIRQVR